jgi:hypothetical protein
MYRNQPCNNRKKRVHFVAFILAFAATILFAPNPLKAQGLEIDWAFGAISRQGTDRTPRPIDKTATFTAGDELKLYFHSKTSGYSYVFHQDTKDNLEMLYPSRFDAQAEVGSRKGIFSPDNGDWFALDH